MFLSGLVLGSLGCGGDEQDLTEENTSIVLSEEEKEEISTELAAVERYFPLPIERRQKEAAEMMRKYLDLRDEDPEASLKSLKNAFYILAKGEHPLMEEWLALALQIVGADEALLINLKRFNEIELEIARHNDEDRNYIQVLEETDEEFKVAIDDLKAQGINPNTFKVPITIELDQ